MHMREAQDDTIQFNAVLQVRLACSKLRWKRSEPLGSLPVFCVASEHPGGIFSRQKRMVPHGYRDGEIPCRVLAPPSVCFCLLRRLGLVDRVRQPRLVMSRNGVRAFARRDILTSFAVGNGTMARRDVLDLGSSRKPRGRHST